MAESNLYRESFGSTADEVIAEVMGELRRSISLHPEYPSDPLRRCAIMCEESGEALRDALDLTRPGFPEGLHENKRTMLHFEVVQTAAMAVKMLIAMRLDGSR